MRRARTASEAAGSAVAPDDLHLPPAKVGVVLLVNSYHECRQYHAMAQHLCRALQPGGLLGLIDGTVMRSAILLLTRL